LTENDTGKRANTKQTETIFNEKKKSEFLITKKPFGKLYPSIPIDILDSSAMGIFILDSDFKVAWINHSIEKYFGILRDKVIGSDKRKLIKENIQYIFEKPDEFIRKVFATYDDNTYIENFECHILPKNTRKERWMEHWSQPISEGVLKGGRIEYYYDISARKKTERKLKHGEKRFAGIFYNYPEAAFYESSRGIILDANPLFTKLFGYARQELIGKKIDDVGLYPKGKIQEGKKLSAQALKIGLKNIETVRKHKKGRLINVEISSSFVKINKKIVGILGVYKDITDKKQSERIQKVLYNISKAANSDILLKELYPLIQKELHKIINATNFHISLFNEDKSTFSYFRDEKDRLVEMNHIDTSKNLASYVTKTGKSILVDYQGILKMASMGNIELSQLGTLTENVVWLGVPLKIKESVIGSMAVLSYTNSHHYSKKDIALLEFVSTQVATAIEKKRIEEKLKEKHQEFASLFHDSPEALVYVNEDSVVLDINRQFSEMFGYSLEEIKGKNVNRKLIHPIEKIKEAEYLYQKSLKGSYYNYETIRRKKNGNLFAVAISSSSVFIDGKTRGRIISYQDISERKKNEKIQEILYNISRAANSSISLDHLYPLIHRELGKIIDVSNFYIALFERKKDILYFPYHVDERDNNFPIVKFSSSNVLTAMVIKRGKPLLNSSEEYEKMVASGELSRLGSTSSKSIWLGVPLKIADRVIGAMAVQSYDNPNLYGKEDIHLLEYVSEQIATAIERKRMEEELRRLAHHDPLTGIYNRAYGIELLERQIKISKRKKNCFLLGYIDMDNLKEINDRYGHEEGDRAINQLAHIFKSILREIDIIIRIGGDEFLIVFPESLPKKTAVIKKRMYNALARHNRSSGNSYKIGFSIGFSHYDHDKPESIDELIRIADQEMYREKNNNTSRK